MGSRSDLAEIRAVSRHMSVLMQFMLIAADE
jgi:hypothetical protein